MRELQGTTRDQFKSNDESWENKKAEQANVAIVDAMYRAIEKNDVEAVSKISLASPFA